MTGSPSTTSIFATLRISRKVGSKTNGQLQRFCLIRAAPQALRHPTHIQDEAHAGTTGAQTGGRRTFDALVLESGPCLLLLHSRRSCADGMLRWLNPISEKVTIIRVTRA